MTAVLPRKVWTYWDKKQVSPGVEQCIKSWRHHLGDEWEITVVDDAKLRDLVPRDYLPKKFASMDAKKKSDSARVALVRKYGGVWADSHVIMLEDYQWLETLFGDGATFVGYANPGYSHDKEKGKELIESWWFAALPESPVITAWNKNWVNGVNSASSPPNFKGTEMYKRTSFPAISEETKNYLFIAVALRHARDTDPATVEEFKKDRAKILMANDGPIWHWDEKNHDIAKLKDLDSPRFFKLISLQHKHADAAARDRSKMHPFYRHVFDVNAPQEEKLTAESTHYPFVYSVVVVIYLLLLVVALVRLFSNWERLQCDNNKGLILLLMVLLFPGIGSVVVILMTGPRYLES